MATEMAVAYLNIVPSLKGGPAAIRKELGSPVKAAGDQAGRDAGKAFTSSFGSSVKGVGKLAAAGIATATVAAGAFATKGVMASVDFGRSMNEVFTLLPGTSQKAMDAMTGDVKDFAKQFGVLPEKVVPALYQSLSAGVPPGNVFDFLATAQKAAAGGVTDLETAVDGISSTVNAYGKDVISATQASDLMFTAVVGGKTTFKDLSESLFQVNPVAAALGVKFGDVTAALAAITSQGVPTSVATTQLRAAFVELSQAGGETAATFEKAAGKSFKKFIAEGGNTQEALQLMERYAKKTGVGVNDLFSSVEAGGAALALTGKGTDKFTSSLKAAAKSSGATDAAFKQMQKGLGPLIDRSKAAAQVFLINLGDKLAPVIITVANLMKAVLAPAISLVSFAIGQIAAGFNGTATVIPDNWIGSLVMLGFHARLAFNTVKETLAKIDFGAIFRAIASGVAPVVAGVGSAISAIVVALSKVPISDILKSIGDFIGPLIPKVAELAGAFAKFGGAFAAAVVDIVVATWPKVEAILPTLQAIISAVGTALTNALGVLTRNMNKLKPVLIAVAAGFVAMKAAKKAQAGIRSIATTAGNAKAKFEALKSGIKGVVEGTRSGIAAVKDFGAKMKDGATAAGSWAKANARAAIDVAKNAAATLAAKAKQIALTVAQKAAAIAQWALNAAMSANPIGLIVIALVLLVAGLVLAYKKVGWFRDLVNAAFGVVKRVGLAVFNAVKGAIVAFATALGKVPAKAAAIKDSIIEKLGQVADFIKGIPGKILAFATQFLNAGKSIGSSILDGIKKGITGAVGFVKDIASGLWKTVKGFVNDNVIDRLNDAIPNNIGPFNLPDNPIKRLHTGGPVTGPAGSEQLRILEAGEWVLSRAQVSAIQSAPSAARGTEGRGSSPLIGSAVIQSVVGLERVKRELTWAMAVAG